MSDRFIGRLDEDELGNFYANVKRFEDLMSGSKGITPSTYKKVKFKARALGNQFIEQEMKKVETIKENYKQFAKKYFGS